MDPDVSAGTFRLFVPAAVAVIVFSACDPAGEEVVPLDCEGAAQVQLSEMFQEVHGPICSSCHTGAGEDPDQSTEAGVAALVGVESRTYAPLKFIVAGEPAASLMYLKVAGGTPAGFRGPGGESVGGRMPPGQSLTAARRELLRGWICSGAPR